MVLCLEYAGYVCVKNPSFSAVTWRRGPHGLRLELVMPPGHGQNEMFANTETLPGLESSKDVVGLLSVSCLLRQEATLGDFSLVGLQGTTTFHTVTWFGLVV